MSLANSYLVERNEELEHRHAADLAANAELWKSLNLLEAELSDLSLEPFDSLHELLTARCDAVNAWLDRCLPFMAHMVGVSAGGLDEARTDYRRMHINAAGGYEGNVMVHDVASRVFYVCGQAGSAAALMRLMRAGVLPSAMDALLPRLSGLDAYRTYSALIRATDLTEEDLHLAVRRAIETGSSALLAVALDLGAQPDLFDLEEVLRRTHRALQQHRAAREATERVVAKTGQSRLHYVALRIVASQEKRMEFYEAQMLALTEMASRIVRALGIGERLEWLQIASIIRDAFDQEGNLLVDEIELLDRLKKGGG